MGKLGKMALIFTASRRVPEYWVAPLLVKGGQQRGWTDMVCTRRVASSSGPNGVVVGP